MTAGRHFTVVPDGVVVFVRLTPKGGRDALDGVEHLADGQSVLKARVRAAPSDGEANSALIKLLARSVSVPPRDVAITAGAASRIKRVKIDGDAAALAARLEELSHAPQASRAEHK